MEDLTKQDHIVVVAGPFPPPIAGLATMVEHLANEIAARCQLRRINLSGRTLDKSLYYHVRRFMRVLDGCRVILSSRRSVKHTLCVSSDGGWGILYTTLLVASGRLTRHRIFIYHQTYSYIYKRLIRMSALTCIAGQKATHILVCGDMAQQFTRLYKNAAGSLVVSNAWYTAAFSNTVESPKLRVEGVKRQLVIGLLSNLMPEKGLTSFLATLREAVKLELPIKGVLAGRAVGRGQQLIEDALEELGNVLEYRGILDDKEKARFYREIDVFLFPSRMPEAQPLVILEAMINARPVIAYDRGCTKEMISHSDCVLVDYGDDFVAEACERLSAWTRSPEALSKAQHSTRARANSLIAEATQELRELINQIVGT